MGGVLGSLSRQQVGLLVCAFALGIGCGDDGSSSDDDPGDGGSTERDLGTTPERDGSTPAPDGSTPGSDGGPGPSGTLSADHPGDEGMGDDPDVVWFEDFEEGSREAIAARYDQVRDNGRWTLVSDTPNGSGSALAMRAGGSESAVDLYKQLPDSDEWYVRWYAHYEEGGPWHHSGMWFGGYNPAMGYPSPNAGNRPNGDDRFSIAIEPNSGEGRLDFYNYWMTMRSWMAEPIDDNGSAFYGNSLVHRNDFTIDAGSWICLEVHARVNTDLSSGAGAVLEVWKNDELVRSFTDEGPMGWWIRDKFCPADSDGSECTDYPAPADEILDLQFRSVEGLRLNAFWPQNYISTDGEGTLVFDQMVVATRRVGCMQ